MKALVIGAGIGGPVAAVALRRAGLEVEVYEGHARPAEYVGLFLGLGVNGMRVLRELDLLGAVLRQRIIATPEMEFMSTTGRRVGRVSNGWLDGTPSITLMRGALQTALADAAVERGVEVRYGKRLVAHDETAEGVVARFEDGSEAYGDVLIGADGIHSRVRRAVSPNAPEPSYTGLLNVGAAVRRSGLAPTPGTMHMVWGRRAFFGFTVAADGEAWWFANVGRVREPARAELTGLSTAWWQRELHALFADDPAPIAQLVERSAQIMATPIHDLPSLPRWWRGRAVLLGDAAHAVSPSAGQGASLAIEDAFVLARCLRDLGAPEEAFARYEELRRPRAERIVRDDRRRGTYKALQSGAAVWLRDHLMPYALKLFASPKRLAWIHDHPANWDEVVRRGAS